MGSFKRWFPLLLTILILPIHSRESEAQVGVDATSVEEIISRLEKLSLLYNNVAIRGSNLELINGKPDQRFSNPTIEYCQLSEQSRVVRRNRHADDNTQYDQYLVASPDISFIAKRFDDGKQEIQQLSARRGMEYDSVFFAGLSERYMALHAYSVYGCPLSQLIARRQLQMRTTARLQAVPARVGMLTRTSKRIILWKRGGLINQSPLY